MEWRPDSWENPYTDVPYADYQESLWEAGADAIIQALYKEVGSKKIWLDKADDGHIIIYVEQ